MSAPAPSSILSLMSQMNRYQSSSEVDTVHEPQAHIVFRISQASTVSALNTLLEEYDVTYTWDDVDNIYASFFKNDHAPNAQTFFQLFKICIATERVDKLKKYLSEMDEIDCKLEKEDFVTLINLACDQDYLIAKRKTQKSEMFSPIFELADSPTEEDMSEQDIDKMFKIMQIGSRPCLGFRHPYEEKDEDRDKTSLLTSQQLRNFELTSTLFKKLDQDYDLMTSSVTIRPQELIIKCQKLSPIIACMLIDRIIENNPTKKKIHVETKFNEEMDLSSINLQSLIMEYFELSFKEEMKELTSNEKTGEIIFIIKEESFAAPAALSASSTSPVRIQRSLSVSITPPSPYRSKPSSFNKKTAPFSAQ